jgi:hypothetical protein
MSKKLKLGDRVVSRLSGFSGVVVARSVWLYGCVRYGVQAEELKDGIPLEAQWFDDGELVKASGSVKGGPSRERTATRKDPRPAPGERR